MPAEFVAFRRMGLALLLSEIVFASVAQAETPRKIEFLGDSAIMTSKPGARRLAAEYDFREAPCPLTPEARCEVRRFIWSARPDEDETWEALKTVPLNSEDLMVSCEVEAHVLTACVAKTVSGVEPSPALAALALGLVSKLRLPAKDLAGVATEGAEIGVPVHWAAIKNALDGGPGSRPIVPAQVAPFEAKWKSFGPAGPYTPEITDRFGVRGSAILDCLASSTGALSDCEVANEYPFGFGFGEAMQKMATTKIISIPPGTAHDQRVWVRQAFGR